ALFLPFSLYIFFWPGPFGAHPLGCFPRQTGKASIPGRCREACRLIMRIAALGLFPVAPGRTIVYSAGTDDVINRMFCPMKETETETEKQMETAEPLAPVEPATVTPEQLAELKDRAAKCDEHRDRLLRTTADFENFKKRAAREKQDAIKYANQNLLQKLIPVLDNFDSALAATQAATTEDSQALQQGINMIWQQFKAALAEAGLEEIDALGKPF